ncbi:EBP domain-containing protein [Rhizoctonia solani AG-1 IA]|uniref:EBP domain-containing protein n=1 Tax=Thanatephorus cucumeris (strain AG1-IA) TaxID=983506 RepID=L8X7A8_THACA|nr:EBP domain-containing protein [Rhizoctonia solani AG-1 IA]
MSEPLFTAVSFYSLAGVVGILGTAYGASNSLLRKNASFGERAAFVWLAFDALIHFIFEGSFLYYSTFGRTVNNGSPCPGREYARADFRWGTADETVVSLELLTVFGAGPLCCYILYQLINNDPRRHYWIVVLCTAELYGGWMTFCPEWLTGSKNLRTDNFLYFWLGLYPSMAYGRLLWCYHLRSEESCQGSEN